MSAQNIGQPLANARSEPSSSNWMVAPPAEFTRGVPPSFFVQSVTWPASVSTSALAPTIARGSPVLVVKRGFEPARAQAGMRVALRKRDDVTPMGRIVAVEGQLTVVHGDTVHELNPGDCLRYRTPKDTTIRNASHGRCRYIVAVLRSSKT